MGDLNELHKFKGDLDMRGWVIMVRRIKRHAGKSVREKRAPFNSPNTPRRST